MIEQIILAEREVWGRRSIVRGHIDNSIVLLFAEAAKPSINVLAMAAVDVLRGVLKTLDKASASDDLLKMLDGETRKNAIKIFKAPYNFAKHADRDADHEIEVFSGFPAICIFLAIADYKIAYAQWSFRMLVFAYWFSSAHSEWIEKYKGDALIHNPGWFNDDHSLEKAASVLNYFESRPELVASNVAELGADWIEFP